MRQARRFVSRRSFVKGLPGLTVLPAAAGAAATGLVNGVARAGEGAEQPAVHDGFPAQDPALVREIVGVSHGNYERAAALVEASPALAKATWDWGFGDWETALGAASHTGNRRIAEMLIANGARPSIFSAAMLGQVDVVRAFVEASSGGPPVQRIPGPHGITLLRHAQAGGEPARAVVEYLELLGDADMGQIDEPLTAEQRAVYLGTYAFGAGERERIRIFVSRQDILALETPGGTLRNLFRSGEHTFHPAGAAAVRVVFGLGDGRAELLTVHDPDPIVIATRAD